MGCKEVQVVYIGHKASDRETLGKVMENIKLKVNSKEMNIVLFSLRKKTLQTLVFINFYILVIY